MSRLPSLPNTFKTVSFFFPGNPVVRSSWDAASGLAGASHDVPGPTTSQERGELLQKKKYEWSAAYLSSSEIFHVKQQSNQTMARMRTGILNRQIANAMQGHPG